jgi:hypothetical protein
MKKIQIEGTSDPELRWLVEKIKTQCKDTAHTVFLVEKEERRSLPQLRYYWGVVLDDIANMTGYYPDEIHDFNKKLFGLKTMYFIGEEAAELIKGLSKMNKKQATEFIDRVVNHWTSQGVIMRQPEHISDEEFYQAMAADGED